jgi:hypothetical protein
MPYIANIRNGQIESHFWGFLPAAAPLPDSTIQVLVREIDADLVFDTATQERVQSTPVFDGTDVTITYTIQPLSLETVRARALVSLASRRYAAQIFGTTFGGISVKTDSESLTLITGAKAYVDAARDGGNTGVTVNFKTSGGTFVTLNGAEVDAISLAVGQHVQACFANEAAIAAQIKTASTVAAVLAVDLSLGWPT